MSSAFGTGIDMVFPNMRALTRNVISNAELSSDDF